MAVDEDEDMDDEEVIPLSEMRKMKMEAIDIDDLPLKQRMIVKKEKLAGRSFSLSAKAESVSVIIDIDSD